MATLHYRYTGALPVRFSALDTELKHGDVIETGQRINQPDSQEVEEFKKAAAKAHK